LVRRDAFLQEREGWRFTASATAGKVRQRREALLSGATPSGLAVASPSLTKPKKGKNYLALLEIPVRMYLISECYRVLRAYLAACRAGVDLNGAQVKAFTS
jgi:hypothetical protein